MNANILQDLSNALNPVNFARRKLGIEPDPWQQDVLLSSEKRIIILAARQSGKSMTCSIYALWHALNHPGALVLVLSPSLRQSGLLFKTIMGYYQELRPIASEIESALTLQLANKSKIVSLPGNEKTIRGYSGVSLLIIDEASQVLDSTYFSVRPMMAVSEGKVFAIGTPHGKRGWFYDSWTNSDEFKKIKVTADQNPRISPEFLEQERKALGQYWYEQEYFCEFHQSEASLFRYDVIQRALCDDIEELGIDLDVNVNDRTGADDPNIDDLKINLD
jgi:phage terminase large subunit-like protein